MNRCLLAFPAAFCALTVTAADQPAKSGFTVKPPLGWTAIRQSQSSDVAMWGRRDPKDPRHTAVAVVRISPEAPVKLTVADLRQAAEQKLKQQNTGRIRDFHSDLREGIRRGAPSLELRTRCVDTGVTPAARMVSYSFLLITPDNRLLVATVSERSSDAKFRFNAPEAAKFLDSVSW